MFRHVSFNSLSPLKYSTSNDKKKTISSKIDRVIAIYNLKNTDIRSFLMMKNWLFLIFI